MKTVAYLRVSTGSQDLANQKMAVLDYARQQRFTVDRFVEAQVSSRKTPAQRGIEDLLGTLAAGDRLVVSELSRLGRSLGQVIRIVDELVKRKVRFIAIKEAIRFEGKQDMQTKVMIALFGLFAEVERDLISQRTKEGLAAARARGRLLGRPKGALGKSKLDGKEEEIRMLLEKTVSKASIAKIVGVSRTALHHFIRTRKLAPKASKGEPRGAVLRAYFRRNLGGTLWRSSDLSPPTAIRPPCVGRGRVDGFVWAVLGKTVSGPLREFPGRLRRPHSKSFGISRAPWMTRIISTPSASGR